MIILEAFQEKYAAWHDGKKFDIPDEQSDPEKAVLPRLQAEPFLSSPPERDREILKRRMYRESLEIIAEVLGFQTHSAVFKRIRELDGYASSSAQEKHPPFGGC